MNALLTSGVIFASMGVLAILIEEGIVGLLHPLDFWGGESSEPIKRAGFHVFLVGGVLMLIIWLVGTAVRAIT
jgi:hypothetical protein